MLYHPLQLLVIFYMVEHPAQERALARTLREPINTFKVFQAVILHGSKLRMLTFQDRQRFITKLPKIKDQA